MSSSSTEMELVPVQVEDSENDSTISSLSSVSGLVTKRAILAGLAVLTAVAVLAVGVYALAGAAPRCPEADARAGHHGRQLTVTDDEGNEVCAKSNHDLVFAKWVGEHEAIKITHHAERLNHRPISEARFQSSFGDDTEFVDKFEKIVERSGGFFLADVVTALDVFRTQLFVTKGGQKMNRTSGKWDYEVTKIIMGEIIIGENGDTTEWNEKELIWRNLASDSRQNRMSTVGDSAAVVFKIEGIKIKEENKWHRVNKGPQGSHKIKPGGIELHNKYGEAEVEN